MSAVLERDTIHEAVTDRYLAMKDVLPREVVGGLNADHNRIVGAQIIRRLATRVMDDLGMSTLGNKNVWLLFDIEEICRRVVSETDADLADRAVDLAVEAWLETPEGHEHTLKFSVLVSISLDDKPSDYSLIINQAKKELNFDATEEDEATMLHFLTDLYMHEMPYRQAVKTALENATSEIEY